MVVESIALEKYFPFFVKSICFAFISILISGCTSDDKGSISIPVLKECRGFADTLINSVKAKSDFPVELRQFYIKPMSHNELYGYIDIHASPSDVYQKLKIEINTYEAYCYSDTHIMPLDNDLVEGVEKEIKSAVSGAHRKGGVYIKVNDGQLHIYVNKLDSN